MSEILTCSAFLIHQPLLVRWRDTEKQWIEYINGVNFSTKYNTPKDRLDRLEKIEASFKKIGIPYSIYNRGLYQELHEEQMKEQAEQKKLQEEQIKETILIESSQMETLVVKKAMLI
jgi:hypothetical protein